MKRIILCALAIFITATAVMGDNLILPGTRMDGAFIGMNYSVISKAWGPADESAETGDGLTAYKSKKYLTVFYVKDGALSMVETFSSSFITESGIKVGSHRQDVSNAYGAPLSQENYTLACFDGKNRDLYMLLYTGEGIGFSFDSVTHKVFSIIVFPGGKFIDIFNE